MPQVVYGFQLEKVTEREKALMTDPKELEVREVFKSRAAELDAKLKDVPAAMAADRAAAEKKLADLKAAMAPEADIDKAEAAIAALPATEAAAREAYATAKAANEARARPLGGMPAHATPFPGATEEARDIARKNFLALVFCLMVGTAALPHILMRYYTTPSVREARQSVAWSLFFICLLYLTAPALAVLVKYEVFSVLVGTPFNNLPAWVSGWAAVDPTLLSVTDVNKDGILQLGEIRIGADIIVLATPEIAGLPYVINGLVAAGGLAADAVHAADHEHRMRR